MPKVENRLPFVRNPQLDRVIYSLDASRLDQHQCHLFCFDPLSKDFIVAIAIEFMYFNPNQPALNEKFVATKYKFEKFQLMHFSFPIEYMSLLEKIANIEQGSITPKEGCLYAGNANASRSLFIHFPRTPNVIEFKGAKISSFDKAEGRGQQWKGVGNALDRIDID